MPFDLREAKSTEGVTFTLPTEEAVHRGQRSIRVDHIYKDASSEKPRQTGDLAGLADLPT
jgi:hypothetical protein